MKTKQLTVIGTNHRKQMSRIWIEGKRLVEAGFTVGARYNRTTSTNPNPSESATLIQLFLDRGGKYKVSGKGDKPIIDISGAVVREVFPDSGDDTTRQMVEVTYEQGCITIARPQEGK